MKIIDLSTYKTPAAAAKALYKRLCECAVAEGQLTSEVTLSTPQRACERGYGSFWRVTWEAGPYEWGILLSLGGDTDALGVKGYHGPNWYLEPHYSFDVGFITN